MDINIEIHDISQMIALFTTLSYYIQYIFYIMYYIYIHMGFSGMPIVVSANSERASFCSTLVCPVVLLSDVTERLF